MILEWNGESVNLIGWLTQTHVLRPDFIYKGVARGWGPQYVYLSAPTISGRS